MTKKDQYYIMMHHLWKYAHQDKDLGKYNLEEAWAYFEQIEKNKGEAPTAELTANGRKILAGMQKMHNPEASVNMWTAKEISEFNNTTSASISGGMRKLISDGFAEKSMPGSAVNFYQLTPQGLAISI